MTTKSAAASSTRVRPAHAAEAIAMFADGLEPDAIPAEVSAAAMLHLLDTLGCGLAALGLGVGGSGHALFGGLGGASEASVLGLDARLPAHAAAFANAERCHALDFDDTHAESISHIGVVVAPAALAAAEAAGADGRELLAALVIGTEVVARLGAAASSAYMTRGFHPTSVCGVFGAAVASARLRSLSVEAHVRSLGIAGSMSSGVFEYLNDGSETKPIHAGWAAHGGVVAAALAGHGAQGPASVVEGRFGLLNAYFDGPRDIEERIATLGSTWETPRVAYKPFPACHFVHAAVHAARLLRPKMLDPDDVVRVVVSIPAPGVPLVAEPRENKIAPRTPYEAKFSIQYSVAAMLVHGAVDVSSYTPVAIADPAVLAVADRVEHEAAEFPTYPSSFPGAVRVELRNGSTLELTLPHQLGSVENPMSDADVLEKFRANASLALDGADVAALAEAVLTLPSQTDLAGALAPLRRARPRREEAGA